MPDRVNEDEAYQNAKMHSDRQNAKIEHDAGPEAADNGDAPGQHGAPTGSTQRTRPFQDDLNGMIFKLTYQQ